MKQYIPQYFQWHELVPSAEYKDYWLYLIDDRLLMSLDAIREHYKRPVTVNNWFRGGKFSNRGLRPMNSSVGAKFSQHKYGRAADFDVDGIPARKVRDDIKAGLFPLITCIEDNVSWVHIDVRNATRLMIVLPK